MKSILDKLHDSYIRSAPQPEAQQEIDENHKLLIKWLEKQERKQLLRTADDFT